ncbi:hypothetical protein ACLOAV_002883 [Pseudogymnoascus australis]
MDRIDAANSWSEAARRRPFLMRNVGKSSRDMGSLVSRQESSHDPKRPAGQENSRARKRQRIGIDDLNLAKKLEECKLARKNNSTPESLEEPSSLEITFSSIFDKYGDKHESLIPRRLDGVAVKTRCSVQIYHPTSECQNGNLTNIHEELLRISQEGDIRTTWDPETGHPETEINLPQPFVVPIRELYVPKPPAAKSGGSGTSVQSLGEISDSEDDSDELLDQGEYGLAEKYFCHVSFSTVRARPWPPLGLGSEISQSSPIGKQLRFGHSNRRDVKLVSKTELLPLESLSSMKVPLEVKLGPDRQTTQYQLALNAKWGTPGVTRPKTEKLETPSKPNCTWKLALEGQAPSESKIGDCTCGLCLAKLDSIKALNLHLRANHSQFEFAINSSLVDEQEFLITVLNKVSAILPEVDTQIRSNSPVSIRSPANSAQSVGMHPLVNISPSVGIRSPVDTSPSVDIRSPANKAPSVGMRSPVNNSPSVDIRLPVNIFTSAYNASTVNTHPSAAGASSADIDMKVDTAPGAEIMRSIFDFDDEDDLSSTPSIMETNPLPTPEPPCVEDFPNPEQLPARDPSTSASASEPQSKTSSLNTTPDAGSESDVPEPRKRIRGLNSRPSAVREVEDEDEASSLSSPEEEDATPKLVVPKTAGPLYDILTRRLLKPGEPLPPSTVSHEWRIRKQADLINSISDITPAEKEFMNRWDPFVFRQKSTSKIFMPAILKDFININRQWFDDKQCRKQELLKHLLNLRQSHRIEENCVWDCFEMFQSKRIYPPKARRARKAPTVADEERSLIEQWDSYVHDSKPSSLEKFIGVAEALRSGRSVHVAEGESVAMLRLFFSYHKRTSGRDQLALDGIFFNSKFPLLPTEAESEYVRFFNSFKAKFEASDGTEDPEKQLMYSFFADNIQWFYDETQRFEWAKKHLQELHWTKKMAPKFRQKLVTYLETMERALYPDEDMPDATVVGDLSPGPQARRRNKGRGKKPPHLQHPRTYRQA